MNVKTLSYVNVSDVFRNASRLWEAFTEYGDWPFTWGDNEYSLIDADRLIYVLEEIVDDVGDDMVLLGQFEEVKKTLSDLSEKGIYVNLEG